MATKKTMVLTTSAAALALITGLGVAGVATAADSSSATSPATTGTTQSAPAEQGGQGRHSGHRGMRAGDGAKEMASSLATKLGVDESKLTAALKTFRADNKPVKGSSTNPKPSGTEQEAALAKSLASSLGIDESKVTTALTELRTENQAKRAAALKTKLDAAVTAGTLTQAEADAVTKAVGAGVIGGR